MLTENFLFAFSLTLLAGLSTGIGSLIAFFSKKFNPKFLAGSLGFSAGVMIYVSMIEIFTKAKNSLVQIYGDSTGYLITTGSFFCGIAFIGLIDKLVPIRENPHEIGVIGSDVPQYQDTDNRLLRMGIFSAIAIAIHNFPEGLATFFGALQNPFLGISIAVAIAIHNIPEGIVVSVPIYYATKSRKRAFWLSFLSGIAEPIGALIGFFILINFMSDSFFGIVFAGVAGIMVYISLDELLPTAEKYGEHHIAIFGLIIGMATMASSLILFL